jgi:hypothetical protein
MKERMGIFMVIYLVLKILMLAIKEKITLFAFILLLFSCKKEKDLFQYTIRYNNPHPSTNAANVDLRYYSIGFESVERTGLAAYANNFNAYFDTINPPMNIIAYNYNENNSIYLSLLLPNKTYYWAYSSDIPTGKIWSDMQSFTTSGFVGNWKLDGIASKKGYLEENKKNGYQINWVYWRDWNDRNIQFLPKPLGYQLEEYSLNKDSLIEAEVELDRININRGR